MLEEIQKYKKVYGIWFYVLLPILAIGIGFSVYKKYQVYKADDSLQDMVQDDKQSIEKENALKKKADEHKQTADQIGQQIKDIENDKGDDDWHKQYNWDKD